MSGVYSDKYGMYFAKMNPLSARIYSDIQAVSERANLSPDLSYSSKCAVLDKHLIHDRVKKRGNANDDYEDHLASLMMSVYPKKPEKYIYDESDNSYWLDEHSEPFFFCTESQVNCCKLGEFIKNLPIETREKREEEMKERKSKFLARKAYEEDLKKSEEEWELAIQEEKKEAGKEQKRKNKFGVPNLPSLNSLKKSVQHGAQRILRTRDTSDNSKKIVVLINKEELREEKYEDEVPSTSKSHIKGYVQHTSRPAFLNQDGQFEMEDSGEKKTVAVKKKDPLMVFSARVETGSKDENEDDFISEDEVVDDKLPNQVQNFDLIAELQAKLKKKTTDNEGKEGENGIGAKSDPAVKSFPVVHKVNKPRAPPPPPPQMGRKEGKNAGEPTEASGGDVPKKKAPLPPRQQVPSNPGEKMKKEKSDEDFRVDVSSPCRIATPKTGLEFLDNW